jgi:hypothetical protein
MRVWFLVECKLEDELASRAVGLITCGKIASGVGAAGCLLESDGVAPAPSTAIAKDPDGDEGEIHGPLPFAFPGLLRGKGGILGGTGAPAGLTCTWSDVRLLGAHWVNERSRPLRRSWDILTSHKAVGILDQASGDSGRILEAFE